MSKPPLPPQLQTLVDQGYRRTSNKYGMLSRIDRPDWHGYMESKMHRTINWEDQWQKHSYEEHYMRVYSKDTIEIDPAAARLIPGAGHPPIAGYIPKEGDPPRTIFTKAEELQARIDAALAIYETPVNDPDTAIRMALILRGEIE